MRKRKTMLGLALIVAVLVLGVGYAVVSGVNLTISGTAATETKDLNVYFDGVTSKDAGTTGATVTATSENESLTATIAVTGLKKVGDVVTATYEIKNNEADLSASIVQDSIDNSKSDFFEVTTDMETAKVVAAQGTTTVTVTVKVIKLPIEEADSTTNITVTLAATPVQP